MAAGEQPTSDFTSPPPGNPECPEAGTLAALFPQLQILDLLGRGGMGVVYRARQTKLDRLVALKLIRPDSFARAEFARRFTREARAMAHLNHPNIVMIHDFGAVDGLYYLIMELVEGDDLRKRLDRGPWGPEEALGVSLQVCDALQYAHEHGVVHRDIKPENVLIDPAGRVKLADFGLAKLIEPEDGGATSGVTASRQVVGTPRYMAPEQIENPRAVDHRADIHAVGLVLYEMMTGDVPFGRYELLSERVGTDEALDAIVGTCLARDPAERYQTVDALRGELAEFAENEYQLTHPAHVVAARDATPAPAANVLTSFVNEWGFLIALVALVGLAEPRAHVLENLSPGWDRFTGSLVINIPLIFGLAWFIAQQQTNTYMVPLYIMTFLKGFRDDGLILAQGSDRFVGILAQAAILASGVAACWGWRFGTARRRPLEDLPTPAGSKPDPVMRLVRGPALGLIAVGAVNCLGMAGGVYAVICLLIRHDVPLGFITLTAAQARPLIALSLSFATIGGVILLAGFKLLDGSSFALAWPASVLAMIPFTPGGVIGIPVGLWTLSVLSRPEVANPDTERPPSTGLDAVKPAAPDMGVSALE
jgi:tRNA A-37 threonylcarbamoyl transferase component Bud32